METIYKTKMSSPRRNNPKEWDVSEQTHTRSEIVNHANELLAKELGLDLCSFVGLEEAEVREDDGDRVYYVDKSGNSVEFTEELQLSAAIAVFNSNGHHFEASPLR